MGQWLMTIVCLLGKQQQSAFYFSPFKVPTKANPAAYGWSVPRMLLD